MKYQPGQSGNPGGRPKSDFAISELAKSKTRAALDCLVSIMEREDAPAAARVSAAQAILDRGWGKAAQSIVGRENGPIVLQWLDADTP